MPQYHRTIGFDALLGGGKFPICISFRYDLTHYAQLRMFWEISVFVRQCGTCLLMYVCKNCSLGRARFLLYLYDVMPLLDIDFHFHECQDWSFGIGVHRLHSAQALLYNTSPTKGSSRANFVFTGFPGLSGESTSEFVDSTRSEPIDFTSSSSRKSFVLRHGQLRRR